VPRPDGANAISATTSNFFRSAVGQFIAKKGRIRFDVPGHEPADRTAVLRSEWSTDGTEIVASGGSSTPANGNDIFVMQAAGTGQVDLTNHPGSDTFPAWQP
jgi:hypothetical protein